MSDQESTAVSGVTIKHRFTREVVYQSDTASTVRDAVIEAVKAGADLGSADLGYADLGSADLRYADLGYADLGSADLRYANLRYANLGSANLRSADLRYANLRYANLVGTTCLSITGLPSGHAILAPLPDGWRLTIGCWSGTVPELRELIAKDEGWPEATGEEVPIRRAMLAPVADLCDAWAAANQRVLDEVQAKWAPKTEQVSV